MKFNQWTLALAAAGVVSLGSVAFAEEAQHQVMTALQSTTLSGYVDTSAIWKFGTGNTVVGRSFDGTAKQDGFNLNVVKLTLEKPLDEGQWSAGYKVDLLFGPDANAYGTTSVGGGNTSDFGIKQAYVNLRAPVGNGLDFQMGVFDTIIGYEVFDSYANPNYSRSYAYAIEPYAHTGLLVSYRFTEWLKLAGGVANTWDSPINGRPARAGLGAADESEKTYMGLIELTAPESLGFLKDAKLYAGIVDGLTSTGASATDITSYYVGTTIPTPLEGLSVGAAYDYRGTTQNGTAYDTARYANAVAGYVKYQMNEKLSFANRLEYASGSNGTWYFSNEATDHNNELLGETFTVDYRPWGPNVITRAEFRWDRYLAGAAVPGTPYPMGGGASDGDQNALSVALNVIYKF